MNTPPVDLTNCDREAIHIPGSIQPHGLLLACTGPSLMVGQVSDNAASFLGKDSKEVLGTPLETWLTPECARVVADAQAAGFPRELNPMVLTLSSGMVCDVIVHRSATEGATIVEFERHDTAVGRFDVRLRGSVRRLQDATGRQALLDIAASEVRSLTGFDRVMIYRFDQDWHGHVVSESKRDDLEPFLGLHYPASDIPAQARRLYALNWLRIIPDVAYRPSLLVPELDPGSRVPLDLSFAVLRSVSPIHIQYLTNMGVTASMSVSLIRGGELIGLIACHHYAGPHFVSYLTRETAEYLGQTLSWHLSTLDMQEAAERQLAAQRAQAQVVNGLAQAPTVPAGLSHPALVDLTAAGGAAIVYDGEIHRVGNVPDEALVRRIIRLLATRTGEGIFVTDHLSEWLDGADAYDSTAAGVLAVDISRDLDEYVIWFRPSTERTVDWGGDPRKMAADTTPGEAPPLTPRASFALWREIVRGRSLPWEPWHVAAASELRTWLLGRVRQRAAELQQLNQRLAEADRAKDEFVATVSHELRTPLNAILGWVHMLQTGAMPPERQQQALATVERNARTQAKLVEDLLDVSRIMTGKLRLNVEPVSIGGVVDQTIESMQLAAEAKGIKLLAMLDSEASVLGDPQRLAQVVTNLVSNAVKFTPKGGKIHVSVEREGSSVIIRVSDTGQGIDAESLPHVFERFHQADRSMARRSGGLGLGLAIVRHIVELHGGRATVFSEGRDKGSTFTVQLPVSVVARPGMPLAPAFPDTLNCPPELDGVRVLIVDDESDARDLVEALFVECKATVWKAGSAAEGLALLTAHRPDILISDIGMPNEDGFAFIARVRALPPSAGGRTPAIALTAYARPDERARILLAGFQSHIAKPVEPIEILALAASLLAMRDQHT